MSNVATFHSKAAIQEQASLWVSRLDRGLSTTELTLLIAWLKNEHHRDAMFFMAALWDDISVLDQLSELFPLDSTPQHVKKNNRPKFKVWMIAASLVLTSFFSATLLVDSQQLPAWFPGAVKAHHYQTAIGQQQHFSLTDGSLIHLNTNSMVKVEYTNDSRRIELIQGEVQFDVASDPHRPFTVSVGKKSFTALGTIFNVRKHKDDDIELVVTEGKVLMAAVNISLPEVLASFEHSSPLSANDVIVRSGEKAIINDNISTPVKSISLDEVQRDLAWQQGMLIFDGENLDKVLDDISRYTTKTFSLADPTLAEVKVSGYFKADDIDGLIKSLHQNFNIKTHYQSPQHIILHANNS
ncbi:FecR domain-containing protein [Alteromonadaceae bacterium BrNp21-10]|nr:FecR domain-containing protein [Alteromonadaceae bacterium BrNp21-10]